jgi:hypothetical protein
VDNGDDLVKNNGMIYPEIVDNGIFWFGKMINYDNRISGLLIAKIKTDQPVAVIEQQQNYDIIPYPNPVKNNATINYELLQDDKVTIEIYDSIGKKIKTLATDSPRWAGSNTETIEFSDISEQGTYFIRIKCSKGTVSIKCIKE